MTLITFEDGNVVFRDGKAGTGQECCCEQPLCPYCSTACLEVTLSGFSSTAEGCDCADINDTYILTRGDGCLPRIVALVVDDDGTGAVLSVTLAFDAATGTYYVASVTIVSAGEDYSSAASVDLSVVGGAVFGGNSPVISVASEREEPDAVELIVVPGSLGTGSGAELTPTWATSNTTAGSETWTVTAVTVANGGTEYEELSQVRFPTESDLETKYRVQAFDGFTNVDHAEPVVDTITISTSGGSGATLSITWENDATITDFIQTANPGADGRHWKVASVNVISGGSGYAENDAVSFSLDGRHIDYALNTPQASYLIGSAVVDGSGAITSVPIGFTNPSLYRSDGIIQSVVIEDGGEYYQNSGITTATVENGGSIIATGTAEGGGDFLPGCLYSYCGDIDCDGTDVCLRVSLGIGADTRVLTVELGGTAVARAEISADGNACDSMTFASGDFEALGCTPGSATVSAAACGEGAMADSCCCEVCNEVIGAGCAYATPCDDLYFTEQEAQDRADIFVNDFFAWANSIDIEGALVAAGYSNVNTTAGATVFAEVPIPPSEYACDIAPHLILWSWDAAGAYSGECCGDRFIDYEAAPTVLWDPNGKYGPVVDGPDYPPVTPDGTCDALEEVVIYPCVENPLP